MVGRVNRRQRTIPRAGGLAHGDKAPESLGVCSEVTIRCVQDGPVAPGMAADGKFWASPFHTPPCRTSRKSKDDLKVPLACDFERVAMHAAPLPSPVGAARLLPRPAELTKRLPARGIGSKPAPVYLCAARRRHSGGAGTGTPRWREI